MRETFVEVGIIVKLVRSGEYDARLAIFTATGIQWRTIKGIYRPKAKFTASCNLFTIAEFTVSGQSITSINVLVAPYALAKYINRYYLACSFADALFHLEFVEQSPSALVTAIKAITALATTDESCYPIFLDFYGQIIEILGYEIDLSYDRNNLTHSTAKNLVIKTINAFRNHVDYEIQFCEKLYAND
ncbi:MAG: recombination protein O N-terminal domain-containing protein [Clostridia bacterium]|nr:recombination protein O N-terminal domain-containing protein [Clostridia bacterium]